MFSRFKALFARKKQAVVMPSARVTPKLKLKQEYTKPSLECSSLILLCGPSYGDQHYYGSFLLNAVSLKSWALEHSLNVRSVNSISQAAREYLPLWLSRTTYQQDSYITLLDKEMREVMMPYIYDFYLKGWLSAYCYECHEHHDSLTTDVHNKVQRPSTSKWTDEWLCRNGHVLHRQDQEIRWFRSK